MLRGWGDPADLFLPMVGNVWTKSGESSGQMLASAPTAWPRARCAMVPVCPAPPSPEVWLTLTPPRRRLRGSATSCGEQGERAAWNRDRSPKNKSVRALPPLHSPHWGLVARPSALGARHSALAARWKKFVATGGGTVTMCFLERPFLSERSENDREGARERERVRERERTSDRKRPLSLSLGKV